MKHARQVDVISFVDKQRVPDCVIINNNINNNDDDDERRVNIMAKPRGVCPNECFKINKKLK